MFLHTMFSNNLLCFCILCFCTLCFCILCFCILCFCILCFCILCFQIFYNVQKYFRRFWDLFKHFTRYINSLRGCVRDVWTWRSTRKGCKSSVFKLPLRTPKLLPSLVVLVVRKTRRTRGTMLQLKISCELHHSPPTRTRHSAVQCSCITMTFLKKIKFLKCDRNKGWHSALKLGKKCNFKSTKTHFLHFQTWQKIIFRTRKKFKTTKNAIFRLFWGQKLIFCHFWKCK